MEVYEIIKSLKGGAFGQVYLARHKQEKTLYAIKKVKIREMSEKDRKATMQEVKLLQKLSHPNIVAYKDSFIDRDQYFNIVMAYCEGGDMFTKIKNQNQKPFDEAIIWKWMVQMALAISYLHDQKILHRDMKTQNLFLKDEGIQLGDFGIAKVLDKTKELANTCIGTPYYMAPELFKYKPYSYKSDVWALGCVSYEICCFRTAFDAQSFQGLAIKILKGTYPPIKGTYSKPLRDIISTVLNKNFFKNQTFPIKRANDDYKTEIETRYQNDIVIASHEEENLTLCQGITVKDPQ